VVKKTTIIVSLFIILVSVSVIINQQVSSQINRDDLQEKVTDLNQGDEEKADGLSPKDSVQETLLSLYTIDGQPMFSLKEFASHYHLDWNYDSIEGTIAIRENQNIYHLLQDTPVVSKNGIYIPNAVKPFIDQEGNVFLPIEMLAQVFGKDFMEQKDNGVIAVFSSDNPSSDQGNELTVFEQQFSSMNEEEMVDYLSFLSSPLEGASLTIYDSHLPGAPRSYRNGTHEGIDWYSGATGIEVDKSTPVLSMADGVVVRADLDFVELTEEERQRILDLSKKLEHTPQYILDKLRGQTVWIQHPKGVMIRYAHLSKIEDHIQVGQHVKAGDIIGYVGNSGTSDGVKGNNNGLHLHSDILIYDHLFWEHFDKNQIRHILEALFNTKH